MAAPSGDPEKTRTPPPTQAADASRAASDAVAPGMRVAAAWSWRILVIVAVVAVVIFVIIQLRLVVVPFLVAILLAALLVPFSQWLQSKGWPKWLAVVVNEVGVIAVVGGLVTLVVFQVRSSYADVEAQTIAKFD